MGPCGAAIWHDRGGAWRRHDTTTAESRIVGKDGYLQAQIGPRQPTGSTAENKSGKKVIIGPSNIGRHQTT